MPGQTPGQTPGPGSGSLSGPGADTPVPGHRLAGGSAARMILGTLTLGLSGYVFLSVIGHDRFPGPVLAALTSTYLLTNIVGPGVFVAVEQEASRAVSELVQRGRRLAPTLTRIAAVTGLLVVAVLVVVAAAAPTLADRVLEGDAGLLAAIGLTVIGSGAVFLIRGVVAGRGRFGLYAATLLVDGGVRLAGMLALVAAGDRTPALFALVLAAGPVAAALVVGGVLSRGRAAGPPGGHASDLPLSWVSVHRSVALLTVSSVLAFGIANLAPVAVTAALPQAPAVAAGFAVGLVLTRIPLLAMGPVQALLLPRMTRAVARHDDGQLRGDLLRGLAAVGAFGVVLVVGAALLGRFAVRVLFGDALDTSGAAILGLLGASAGLLIAIQFVQPALVALRRPGGLVLGWVAGGAGFLATLLLLPVPPLAAAVTAQLVGPALTVAVHVLVARRALRGVGVRAAP